MSVPPSSLRNEVFTSFSAKATREGRKEGRGMIAGLAAELPVEEAAAFLPSFRPSFLSSFLPSFLPFSLEKRRASENECRRRRCLCGVMTERRTGTAKIQNYRAAPAPRRSFWTYEMATRILLPAAVLTLACRITKREASLATFDTVNVQLSV